MAEMAAVALLDSRPHIDFMPPLANKSEFCRCNGEGDLKLDEELCACKENEDCEYGVARKVSIFFSGDEGPTGSGEILL